MCAAAEFQYVTMRLIVSDLMKLLLSEAWRGGVYVQGEIVHKKPRLKKVAAGKRFHAYCSSLNDGAAAIIKDVGGAWFALDRTRRSSHTDTRDLCCCRF